MLPSSGSGVGGGGLLPPQGQLAHGAGRLGTRFGLCPLLAGTNNLNFLSFGFCKTKDSKGFFCLFVCLFFLIYSSIYLFKYLLNTNFGPGSIPGTGD